MLFSFFKSSVQTIKKALSKTRHLFLDHLKVLFGKPLSEETLEQLEQVLFEADLGTSCALKFTDKIRAFGKKHPQASSDQLLSVMKDYAREILEEQMTIEKPLFHEKDPYVILIVGVNGSGKTTSCAKLASRYKKEGKKVLLAAADTFRAAAIEQLDLWAKKLGVDIVKGQSGSDPSATVFDALSSAKAKSCDVVIADTAGRLQSKTDLMHELAKVRRVCSKVVENAPHETWLVLDATTGQNALDQARVFHSFTPLTGVILTKLDGSAKGGIVLSIKEELKLPILFVGIGEGVEDLIPFDAESYLDALFSS